MIPEINQRIKKSIFFLKKEKRRNNQIDKCFSNHCHTYKGQDNNNMNIYMQKYILKIKKEEKINKRSSIQNQEENKYIKTKN